MKNIFPGNKKKVTTPQSIKADDGKTVIEQPPIAQRFNEFVTGAVSRLLQLLDYLWVSDISQVENLLVNVLSCNRFLKSLFWSKLETWKWKKLQD